MKFDVIKNKKITLIVIGVVLLAGVVSMLVQGFNIDIDFSGGTEIQLNIGTEVTDAECNAINDIIADKLGREYVSSTAKSTADRNIAIIRTGTAELTNEQQTKLLTALDEKYGIDHTEVECEINSVSATIGKGLQKTAILAVLIAVVLMLVYISIRFQFESALAAIVCLCHDVFVMIAVYSIFQIPVNSNIIAALLTILGYSINATIVIFDRIRENKKRFSLDQSFDEIVAKSTKQTLTRSINTTITTLLTIGMVYIMGVSSIRNFALPLIIGIVAGLFSSICLSGMLWSTFDKIFAKQKAKMAARKKNKAKA